MCGRFTLTATGQQIAEAFDLAEIPELSARFNIAPGQSIATIVYSREQEQRQLHSMEWGLVPHWSNDTKIGAKLINARAETVAEKPAFRSCIRRRRCLVIADGFYEWSGEDDNGKQPYYFQLPERRPFAFAGLWDYWQSRSGENMVSCTIITTEAGDPVSPIHDRMPAIVPPSAYERWLDPGLNDPQRALALLQSDEVPQFQSYAVSEAVNNPANESPECIEAVGG